MMGLPISGIFAQLAPGHAKRMFLALLCLWRRGLPLTGSPVAAPAGAGCVVGEVCPRLQCGRQQMAVVDPPRGCKQAFDHVLMVEATKEVAVQYVYKTRILR